MKVKEILERIGSTQTGRTIAYLKDALAEMNLISETHVKTERIDIENGKRFYHLPNDRVKLIDIRCKHHNNNSNAYQSIPRTIYEPETEDTDGI
tara:strand:- start:1152 stop:1433 length:282 start_codon:yes stop_codon:yes gene_type:complete